jgi:hypothetical protein
LKRKGFLIGDLSCRLCHKRRKLNAEEDLAHMIKEHPVRKNANVGQCRTTSKKVLDKDVIKIFKLYHDNDFIKTPTRK